MRPSRPGAQKATGKATGKPTKKPTLMPTRPAVPLQSAAGEEDPGASLDDPEMREAMREESRVAGNPGVARQREQGET